MNAENPTTRIVASVLTASDRTYRSKPGDHEALVRSRTMLAKRMAVVVATMAQCFRLRCVEYPPEALSVAGESMKGLFLSPTIFSAFGLY